jgi:hypothetical protein
MKKWLGLSLVLCLGTVCLVMAQSELINGGLVTAGAYNFCDAVGSTGDAYVCSLARTITSYTNGTHYTIKAPNASTAAGGTSLALNGLAAKQIVKAVNGVTTPLEDGDICAGEYVDVVYDGTNMQLLTPVCRPFSVPIASGAKTLATSAIASGVCAAAETATATGALATDVALASFNTDVSAITGYTPATTGTLRIDVYPTTNTINFKVCNATSASITPGAVTLNWRVIR